MSKLNREKEVQKPKKNSKFFFKRLFIGKKLDEKLLEAVSNDNLQEVKSLIYNGANINARDGLGSTPLILASNLNNLDMVNFLISNNANVDASNNINFTALHFAAKNDNLKLVRLIINLDDEKAAQRINKKNYEGDTILHIAAKNANYDMIEFLLLRNADRTIRNNNRLIPLDVYRSYGKDIRIINLLKYKGLK